MISLGFRQCPCHTALGLLGSEVFVLGDGQCSFSFGPNGQAQGGPVKDVNTGGAMVADRFT